MNTATVIRRKSTSSLLGATALATLLLASPAFAAECSSGSPPAPAPAAGSASTTAGPNPVSVSITGAAGCSGKSADSFHSGNDGGQGQGVDPSSIEMTGGSISSSGAAIGVATTGGAGGDGSGDSSVGVNTTAGSGATGGYGGDWTATIDSGATLSASGTVISVVSTGGAGGTGATGWNNGSGGTGGAGGAISNFTLASGSSVTSLGGAAAIIIQSLGGAGGHQNGSGRAADNVGESAGTGGGAGSMTVHIDGSVSSSSGDGVSVKAQGGDGGSTDSVTAGGAASGTQGGNGGNGATSINFESSGMIGVGGTAISIINSGGNGNGGSYAGAGAVGKGGKGGVGGNGGGITAGVTQIVQGNVGLTLAANGGNGGNGGTADGLGGTTGGAGGAGGTGGTISLTPAGAIIGLASGITAAADGGAGGDGASAGAITSKGGGGGVGGAGGSTTITLSGQTTSAAFGVQASANGGNGGAGGKATSATDSNGGSGGTGGAGGSTKTGGGATVNLLATGSVTTQGQDVPSQTTVVPGILVQSNGGVGGASGSEGAIAGQAGGAGIGGAGGLAVANIAGNVSTSGSFAHGVMAQSVAGIGGGAGHTGDVWSTGGATGGQGGDGGTATVTSTGGIITTTGTSSMGIIAQSVGGGGGAGGNASSNEDSLGGDAGAGGDGGASTLNLAGTVITRGDQGGAALSQSVGGSGGVGGSASGSGVEVTVTIGGNGNNGGTGGVANATNGALLTTFGAKSGGLMAQSVGGGGGNGGAGIGKTDGTNLAVNVTIGGSGGNGGSGGQVTLTNNYQITTYGSDSYGVKAQTIGGGGGEGGAASGTAKATAGGDANAISMTAAIGGSGGSGGNGSSSPLLLTNYGFVATAGDGGIGLMAHNIAGGGGNGGDSSAAAYSDGTTTSNTTSITLGMGGTGGVGGTGGQSTLNNKALVLTLGESAYGMLVQSIGGGGGQGSGGDSSATTTPSNLTGKFTVTLGGNGGGGGTGGAATGDNAGGIATAGDGARGMMVQSIGGGGGAAGGAAGKANGSGGLTIDVTLGGSGGTGGVGGTANGSNHLGIQTTGADADGMFVQSVGGGGGSGGKAASTNGGATDASDLNHQLQTGFEKGLNLKVTTSLVDGTSDVYLVGDGKLANVNGISDLQKVLNSTKVATVGDGDGDGSTTGSLTLNLKIGNSGGTGGNGGTATAYNEGAIRTNGGKSDGIFVQSVGGGGGAGGAVSFTDSAKSTGSLVLGGQGGAAGDGNSVLLTNAAEAEVYTSGATSSALVAQSIGGGGGKGGITASKAGALSNLTVTLGGTGGSGGSGKDVTVNNDVSAYLATQGKNAIGIIAQSVGGGGGITSVLSKDQTGPAGDPDPSSADLFGFHLTFGDTNTSTSSDGGTVSVGAPTENTAYGIGKITTAGRNAYGILAQSIGGGGGLVQGGNPTGTSFFGTGTMKGNGNTVSVEVGNALSTSGVGAVGVFAQSVGGGGGLVGDTGWTQQRQAFVESGTHIGNGGAVSVTVDALGSITTTASNTPAIWAQSIGGGGGLVNTGTGPAYAGSAGGTGTGGTIDITVNGKITVTGIASNGILAQSLGDSASTSPITVTIGATGNIQAGVATQPQYGDGSSAAVYIDHGGLTSATPNKVTNNGTLFTYASGTNSVAVWSTGGYTQVFNNGTMGGDILLQNNGGQGCFTNGTMANGQPASFVSGDAVAVGACGVSNFGTIQIKGSTTGTTTITGDYTGRGKLVFDADFTGGKADKLVVNGNARIGDTISIQPSSISNRSVKLVSATGTLTLDPSVAMADNSHLYDFKTQLSGSELSVMPVASFAAKAAGFGANEKAVAANLQSLFDGGASADAAFTRLLGVADDAGYAAGLQSLAGQGLGAFGAFRFNSSRTFAANLYGGCQDMQLESRKADRCGWGRLLVNGTTQDAGTDTLGYTADSWATQKGVQLPVSDDLALTGSIAYENTKFRDGNGSARITGDSLVGGVGLLYTPAQWELSAGIDAAYGWYKSRRTITLGLTEEANAKPEQSQVGGHVRAAINVLDGGKSFVRPFVEGHAIHVSNKAFTETGNSPFRLAVEGESNTAFIAVAGVEMGTKLPLSTKVTLRPFASAALEYGSPRDWTTTARFADQPQGDSFDLKTAGPETLGRFSIGADLLGSKNIAFSVQYAPELGKDFTSHTGMARLTIAF